MVGVLTNNLQVENFQDLITEHKEDTIVNDEEILNSWLLISTPVPALLTLTVYLYFVLSAGPKFMATRKPFDLRSTMMCYNVLQIAFNTWMFSTILFKTDSISYLMEHGCIPKRIERLVYLMHLYSWCYFLSKLLDLFDTVFMVLRKKQSHITFLHLYHHVSMVLFTWISVKYIVAQQGVIPAVINMFVHMVMYGYYFLASLGPLVQPYLWWKRYLTKLQLGQFVVVIMYLAYLHHIGCPVSRVFNYIWMVNVAVIFAFFVNFYVQTYLRKKPQINNNRPVIVEVNKNKVY